MSASADVFSVGLQLSSHGKCDIAKMFGVLAIDKPAGMTSRDVVNRIQRLIRPVKVGHTGTLDPMATGVLLIAIGPATRLVEFSHDAAKSYQAEFLLGRRSDTLDIEGEVTELANAPVLKRNDFIEASRKWLGAVAQVPPKYSAINVKGRRAYDLARAGQEFELPSRIVQIHSIDFGAFDYPSVSMTICCGTGTYIRSLGSDIAQQLGSDAVMSQLVRTSIGNIRLSDCVALEHLLTATDVEQNLLPPNELLNEMPTVRLSDSACVRIRNGLALCDHDMVSSDQQKGLGVFHGSSQRWAALDEAGDLVAILRPDQDGDYRSLRVFQKTMETPQPKISSTPHNPES